MIQSLSDITKPPFVDHAYIGDGVYVGFDRWGFLLATERPEGVHFLYLGYNEVHSLQAFVKQCQEKAQVL